LGVVFMSVTEPLILLLFAAIPVYRLIAALRQPERRPGALSAAGIILSIVLGMSGAGVLMAFSLLY